jgi:hypothetical protein
MAGSRSSKTKALWSGAITVAVLAVVLIVAAAISPQGSKNAPAPGSVTATQPSEQSQLLYEQALQAQASGDLTRTVELAKAAVQADPNNTQAQALVTSASSSHGNSNPPTPDSSGDGGSPSTPTTTTPSDTRFMKYYKHLSVLAPKAFSGYSLGEPVQLKRDLSMSATPIAKAALASNIVWAVSDAETRAAAKRFATKTSKSTFPKDGASVTVDSVPGYFGTDGTQFATVSFARGRYTFEVLASTVPGVTPLQLKALLIEAARAFPDTP